MSIGTAVAPIVPHPPTRLSRDVLSQILYELAINVIESLALYPIESVLVICGSKICWGRCKYSRSQTTSIDRLVGV